MLLVGSSLKFRCCPSEPSSGYKLCLNVTLMAHIHWSRVSQAESCKKLFSHDTLLDRNRIRLSQRMRVRSEAITGTSTFHSPIRELIVRSQIVLHVFTAFRNKLTSCVKCTTWRLGLQYCYVTPRWSSGQRVSLLTNRSRVLFQELPQF